MPAGAVIIKDQFAEHVLDMAVFPTRPPFTNVDGYGIICAVQTAKPFTAAIWRQTLQSSGLRMLHHSQNRLCRFHCRLAAGKPEWACCCGIITAERLLYTSWPGRYAGAARFRPDGRLYHAASRTWYNNRFAVIIPPFHERFQFFLSFSPPGRENRLCKKHMYDNYFLQKNKNFFTNRRKMI